MKSLTEHEIIRILTNRFAGQPGVPLGFDDDVSAIPFSPKTWIIVKTDMLVGSTDVPPGMTVQEAARKAVIATISDFAAKGVKPHALMVSLGLPAPAKKTTVQDIARGLGQAAREYHCKIIGGDTNQANDLVIDIIGVGLAKPKEVVRRDGARPGDIVAVTGPFGRTSAGLRILISKRKSDLAKYPSLVRAARRPEARLTQGIILAKSRATTSSIDSSDGLAWSLHQIAQLSKVGISRTCSNDQTREIQQAEKTCSIAEEDRNSREETFWSLSSNRAKTGYCRSARLGALRLTHFRG